MSRLLLPATVVLLLLPACNNPGSDLPATDLSVTAGNVILYARLIGDTSTQPVVIINNAGPGLSHDYVESLQAALAGRGFAVVAYDARGTGRSTKPTNAPNNFTLSNYAGDLEAIRVALGVDQVHLLGHSFGGLISTSYATTFASHVASVSYHASMPPTDIAMNDARVRLQQRVQELQSQGIIPDPVPNAAGNDCTPPLYATLPAYFSNPSFSSSEITTTACDSATESNTLVALGVYDMSAQLAALSMPVQVTIGRDDGYGMAMGQATADAIPSASLQDLPGCGHFWQECAGAYVDLVAGFFAN